MELSFILLICLHSFERRCVKWFFAACCEVHLWCLQGVTIEHDERTCLKLQIQRCLKLVRLERKLINVRNLHSFSILVQVWNDPRLKLDQKTTVLSEKF